MKEMREKLLKLLADSNLFVDLVRCVVIYNRTDDEDFVPIELFDLDNASVTEEAKDFLKVLYSSEEDDASEKLEDLREGLGNCHVVTEFCRDEETVSLAKRVKNGIFEMLYGTKGF
jgi:hypothetical protein